MHSYANLELNFGAGCGQIAPLHGVNLGPLTTSGFLDLSGWYRDIRPPLVRLHDCPYAIPDSIDVHCIFPLFDADENDPANYCFAVSDDYIQSIIDLGSEPYVRLGETIEHHTRGHYHIHPPTDYQKWARICVNIIRHYTEGWANGFNHTIRYWEVWNEPWHRNCWSGSHEDYFRLYDVTARAIKAHNPALKVGGPSTGSPSLERFGGAFLDYIAAQQSPLDFYSWHDYPDALVPILDGARLLRTQLNERGYEQAEIHLNEWNYHPHRDWSWKHHLGTWGQDVFTETTDHRGAAFDAAMLIGMQDAAIDVATFYWGKEGLWGLFDFYGKPNKNYFTFRAFNRLMETPNRVALTQPSTAAGTLALAGLNASHDRAQILIGRFKATDSAVRLIVQNLPWQTATDYTVEIIDETHELQPVSRGTLGIGSFEPDTKTALPLLLAEYAVALITLKPISAS